MEQSLLIERYCRGFMQPDERHAFEQQLATDARLLESAKLFKATLAVADELEEARLRHVLQQVKATSPKTSFLSNPLRLSIAACFAGLLIFAGFQIWQVRDAALFAQLAPSAAPETSVKMDGPSTPHPFDQGKAAQRDGHFQDAHAYYDAVPPGSPDYLQAVYNTAYIFFLEKNWPDAHRTLDQIEAQTQDPSLRQRAEWLRCLVWIGSRQTQSPDFRAQLARIAASPDHEHQADAAELKDRLDSFWRKLLP